MYLFDYARRSEVLLHSHQCSNKVKQSALIDRWSIVFENLLENSPKKARALIGQKSCLYNSIETQN